MVPKITRTHVAIRPRINFLESSLDSYPRGSSEKRIKEGDDVHAIVDAVCVRERGVEARVFIAERRLKKIS